MAVVVDAWAVIARRAVVERVLSGGFAGWFEIAPNRMACADRDLCLVTFMVQTDAAAFLLQLVGLGLRGERDGAYHDAALVSAAGPWEHACDWLQLGRYAGVHAAWLRGSDPEPLVVPVRWRPAAMFELSAEEAARRLRFVRRDGDVEVFVDVETGAEVYRGRTTTPDQLAPELEAKFHTAVEAIKPLLTFDGHPRKLGWFERRRLAKGIARLEALASHERWGVWWFLGMARRAAGDVEGAFAAFERAYQANPTHADVSREYGGQCLALGRGARAVAVCEQNCSLHPHDAGLRSNLALACVVADDLPRAKAEVARALAMDPADPITRALARMIDDILAGRRPRPTRYP